MQIQLRYFAVVRERLRSEGEPMQLPAGATVADALDRLGELHPEVAALRPHLATAVNQEMVPSSTVLSSGDELALIPPVAGGSGDDRRFAVVDRPITLEEVASQVASESCGAVVTFTGAVRRESRGAVVDRLEYEAYGAMAERTLRRLGADIEAATAGARVAIVHRIGVLRPGEISVVIAVATPHRADAFDACRQIIERLKAEAPIWKKEWAADGTAIWVGLGS